MMSWKQATLIACAITTFGAGTAEAQFGPRCCHVTTFPQGVISAEVGDTVFYDLELDAGKCGLGEVDWTFEAVTDGLQVSAVPGFDDQVQVTILPGAPADSRWVARARNYNPITQQDFCRGIGLNLLDVTDPFMPDLMTQSITLPQTPLVAGQSFDLKATVHNNGPGYAPDSRARLFIDGQANNTRLCHALQPGESCVDLTWNPTLSAGHHVLKVCADGLNQLTETNENNNCLEQTVSVSAAKPDLVILNVTADPHTLAETGQGQVYVEIGNIGATTAGSFEVSLSGPGSFQGPAQPILGLNAGASITETFIWTAGAPLGPGQIVATADSANQVSELLENNNTNSTGVTVLPGLPDLTFWVGGMTMSPSAPVVGGSVYVEVEVRNVGNVGIPGMIYLDVEVFGLNKRFACYSIAAGGSCDVSDYWQVTSTGSAQVKAWADLDQSLPEIDETNNFRSWGFNVSGPAVTCQGNWTLTQISPTPDTPTSVTNPGSVTDDPNGNPCFVTWGQNVATGCWQTSGVGGLQATWYHDGSCPTSVLVTNPNAGPGETSQWTYSVSINP